MKVVFDNDLVTMLAQTLWLCPPQNHSIAYFYKICICQQRKTMGRIANSSDFAEEL